MHFRGVNNHAKISGIAHKLRQRGLSGLGDASGDIYNQVIRQGGTPAQAEAASRSGSVKTFTSTIDTVPYAWAAIWSGTKPSVTLSAAGVAPYKNLSDKNLSFTDVPWTTPILNPHFTNALAWMGIPLVVNRGDPRSIYDPIEYLRSALVDSDWDRVYYWFLYQYADTYKRVANNKNYFFPYADINIFDYKYTVDDSGKRTYYPMSLYDVKQFITRIVANFTIADVQHSSGHCAIGLINWSNVVNGRVSPAPYDVSSLSTSFQWWTAILQGLNTPNQGSSSVLQHESLEQLAAATGANGIPNTPATTPKPGSSPCGDLRVGWVQGPKGDWTTTQIVTTVVLIIIAVITAGLASGAIGGGSAAAVPAAAAGEVGTAAAITSTTVATTAAAGAALDEVIVTGTIAAGTTIGAALSAGAVAATAIAPAISGATAPNITINAPVQTPAPAPVLDEVIVTGTQTVAPSTIAASISAGAVATTAIAPAIVNATAPPITTNSPTVTQPSTQTSPNTQATDNLDEVVITGTKAASTIPTVANAIAVGTVAVTSAPAITNATTVSNPNTTTQPDNSSQSNESSDSPKVGQTLKDWLQSLVKKYGLAWVQQHLKDLLKQFYGQTATQAQVDDANASLQSGINWWVIGAAALAAIAGSS